MNFSGACRSIRLSSLRAGWIPLLVAGCTTFGTVSSASVNEGLSGTGQVSISLPPGDDIAWFYSTDCASECNKAIVGGDGAVSFGHRGGEGGLAYALGGGINGGYPYVEGYVQLDRGTGNPWGLGLRVGIPISGWNEHQLYGRYDIPLSDGTRILLNPTVFYHTGNSPDGELPGWFLAFVQGCGWMIPGRIMDITPALSLVVAYGERTNLGTDLGSFTSVFGTASFVVTVHRPRDDG